MVKVNTIISGEFVDKELSSSWGNVFVSTSAFGTESIDKNSVQKVEYLKDVFVDEQKHCLEIKIYFKSGKESIALVDDSLACKILKMWPRDRLNELLKLGYKIVGFDTNFIGSAYANSNFLGTSVTGLKRMHTILLQKDLSIEIVSIFDDGASNIIGKSNTILLRDDEEANI